MQKSKLRKEVNTYLMRFTNPFLTIHKPPQKFGPKRDFWALYRYISDFTAAEPYDGFPLQSQAGNEPAATADWFLDVTEVEDALRLVAHDTRHQLSLIQQLSNDMDAWGRDAMQVYYADLTLATKQPPAAR